jgi:hypothetical protein
MRRKWIWRGLAGTIVGVGISAGIAAAVWSASGTGSGGGAATIAQGLVVSAVSPSGANATLYPGGPAGSAYFQVGNPNPYAVTITGLAWGTPTSTSTATCPSSNISVDPSAPTTASISIPANTPAGTTYQVAGVLDLAHSAPDGCQGVSFNVPLTVTGIQH